MTDVLAPRADTSAPFLDDAALLQRILGHVDAGTTDLADDVWEEPVANYLSAERLERECALIRRATVPFCPSAALAAVGAFVARDAGGTPLVAVRGHDGVARVFRNACRHRGTTVAEGSGCAKSLVCPFHGWVYRLDGALRHVPGADGFPGLDTASSGLVEVASTEHAGLVWVAQDAPLDTAFVESMPDLLGGAQTVLDATDLVLDTNWKVFTEGFLEGYHIKATHPQTFLPFGYDNLNVIECRDRISRVTFPFRRVEALRDAPDVDLDGRITTVHHVFPNVVVARLSHHTTLAVIEPMSIDRTRLVSYGLTNRAPGEDGADAASRDREFVQQGVREDQAVARRVHVGLRSGANSVLRFGRFEGALTHFHRQLHAALAD